MLPVPHAEGPATASAPSGAGIGAELRVEGAYAALLLDTIDGTCIPSAFTLTAAPPVIPPRPGCE